MQYTSTSTAQHRSHAVTHQPPNTARDTEDEIQAFREHVSGRSVGIVHVIALLPFRVGTFGLPAGRRHCVLRCYGSIGSENTRLDEAKFSKSTQPSARSEPER